MNVHRQWYFTLLFGLILGIRGGNIALWREGFPDAVQVFPYRAEMLPREAQEALANGISIEDLSQLEELAENYLS